MFAVMQRMQPSSFSPLKNARSCGWICGLVLSAQLSLLASTVRAQSATKVDAPPSPAAPRHGLEIYFEPLRREPVDMPLAVPVAMMTSGYFTGVVAAIVALSAWSNALEIADYGRGDRFRAHLDVNDDGAIDQRDELFVRRLARGFGVVSALGIGVGVAGNLLFAQRLRRMRERERAHFAFDASLSARSLTLSLRRGF